VGGERHNAAHQRHCVAARQAASSKSDTATGTRLRTHLKCVLNVHALYDHLTMDTGQNIAMAHAVQAEAAPGEGLRSSNGLMSAANALANMRVLESGYDIK
jgi:hypothetical protein